MDRRGSGGLILVGALLVVLVPRALNPPQVDGLASAVPPRPPVEVGECIDGEVASFALTETGAIMTWNPVTVVACTDPHDGEVVYREDARPDTATGFPTTAINDFQTRCADGSWAPWSSTSTSTNGWQPAVNTYASVLGPDRRQFAAGQRWTACVIGTGNRLDGPLELTVDDRVPPEFGYCTVDGTTAGDSAGVPCTEPHTAENFGYRGIDVGSDLDQDTLISSCRDVVAQATGRPDLAAEAALVISAEANAWYSSDGTDKAVTLPLPADAEGGWASCDVHTTDDRKLTGSLRRIDDDPLPWAP